jgi:hypothetical protein
MDFRVVTGRLEPTAAGIQLGQATGQMRIPG